jgi:hypothetical protein
MEIAMSDLYHIAYRNRITNATGHGTATMTRERAEEVCRERNKEHGKFLEHWPVEAEGGGDE